MDERLDVDPALRSPLARFQGERPPAPAWFEQAIAMRPERSFVEVEGAPIELLTWGERGQPGLLFLHGGRAHADWWSFIAPLFAHDHRVAAMSWSGMGRSGWRRDYSIDLFAREAMVCAETAGLFDLPDAPPTVVAHSFGGWIAMHMAAVHGERLKSTVILDSGVRARRMRIEGGPLRAQASTRVYPTLQAALARFRLMPEQGCDNDYILDYIAREALKPAPMPRERNGELAAAGGDASPPGEDPQGWTWRFDPRLSDGMEPAFFTKVVAAIARPRCPMALVWGDRSRVMSGELLADTLAAAPAGTPRVVIPDAAHHLFLDQPLAVVAGLRGLLSAWPR